MTDKELLELAALASGYEFDIDGDEFLTVQEYKGYKNYYPWNPLESDAVAFQLMVKLNMLDNRRLIEIRLEETRKDPTIDDCKILRRAIVRVAAERGE